MEPILEPESRRESKPQPKPKPAVDVLERSDLRDAYAGLYAGVIYDALRFDLNWPRPFVVHAAVKPLWSLPRGAILFGPAFTCTGARVLDERHVDDTVRIRMFRSFTPGCVQVIDAGGDASVAHFGDISGRLARKFGATGAVVDGWTRDARRLEEDRFPVFCRGAQPIDAFGRWQIVDYQQPIALSGIEGPVPVRPGDLVYGDPDGVIVVPQDLAERVAYLASQRLAREDEVRRALEGTDDVQSLYDRIGRW
ncbi:MAG: RraA family protein [Candidatus Eisenbacteria bacterium]|nr:RraA family protein [Candidatus Eisenbacteria bacterium]